MKIATSKTRDQFPLSTRKILKKTLERGIAWIILFIVELIVIIVCAANGAINAGYSAVILIVTAIIVLIIMLCSYLYQRWYFAVYFYDLDPDYIIIKKGPITPREITIPYERIQDVYVDQDILDRILGLYDVHLSSATISSGMEAHIDGVEKQAADGLRASLLQTVSERISKRKQAAPVQANNA